MPVSVNTADEIAALEIRANSKLAAQDQRIAELEARMAALEDACPPTVEPGPEPGPDERIPMCLHLAFGDGTSLEFAEREAVDVGTYEGECVRQRCLRQVAHGYEDYRDGFVIFFRPDVDGLRDEVIVEYRHAPTCSPPACRRLVFNDVPPQHLAAYTATITGGCLTEPVHVAVPAHYWATRWRWQSAPRPLVRTYDDLVAMRAILPLDESLIYSAAMPPFKSWGGPMSNGGLLAYMPNTGDRPDIGMLTDWQAAWLLDRRTRIWRHRGGPAPRRPARCRFGRGM